MVCVSISGRELVLSGQSLTLMPYLSGSHE